MTWIDRPLTATDRTANVLGALAGTVTDQATAAMLAAADLPSKGSSSSLAALVAIAEFLGAPTADRLRGPRRGPAGMSWKRSSAASLLTSWRRCTACWVG